MNKSALLSGWQALRKLRLGLCWLVLSASLMDCAGSAPAANEPSPPLEDQPEGPVEAAPASSARVQEGIDAIVSEDFEKAEAILSEAVTNDPSDPQAVFYLGVAQEALGRAPDAIESYRTALNLDGGLTEASVNLSALLLDQEQPEQALEVVETALGKAKNHAGLLMNRALALEASGQKDEALEAYEAAVKAAPDNFELRYAFAEVLIKSGKPQRAKRALSQLKNVDSPALAGAVANLFGKLGEFAECISMLDAFLAKTKVADLFVRRGVCHHGAGDDEQALSDYKAAVAHDPNFAPGYYYIGQHYRAAGDKQKARENFKKAAELAQGTQFGQKAQNQADSLK